MYTSLKKLSNILILKQEGTSRQERYMPALHANDRLMDKRSIPEMIAYMQRFSKNLLFIDPEDPEIDFTKSWDHFFKNDILFLIAGVATKNVEELRTQYEDLYDNFENTKGFDSFYELVSFAFSRIRKIDEWYHSSFADLSLNQEFTLYIKSYLQNELSTIREMIVYTLNELNDREKIDRFRNDLNNMNDIWELSDEDDISLRERIFSGKDDQEKLTSASHTLRKTFDTIFHATENIVSKCAAYFEEAIQPKQAYHHNHNPHAALIIAFLRLFEYEKQELNRIPQKHLHFYYNDVLRVKGKEAIPDQTFVTFELAKGFADTLIKKGTQLSAGKDQKDNELIYQTEKDLVLSKTHVSALNTIFIKRNAKKEVLNYYKESFAQPVGKVTSTSIPFNLFGKDAPDKLTTVGFGIASSQFYLTRGERKVTVTLQSPAEFSRTGDTPENVQDYHTGILRLLLTGEKGWIDSDVPANQVVINSIRNLNGTAIEITFTISITQSQAISGFVTKFHGERFNTELPVLQCMLKYPSITEEENSEINAEYINQISSLQNFQVANIKIMVQVGSIQINASFDGVKELILENDESVLESKKPFFPFTSVPKVGSSFFIGCKDLFYKDIGDLSLNLEWVLPEHFSTYYQNYLPPYDLNQFIGTISILHKKQWKKVYDTSIIDVTTTDPAHRSIKLNPEKLRAAKNAVPPPDTIPEYDEMRKDGTIRVKLNYPDFGHGVYPQLITSAVMEKAIEKNSDKRNYDNLKEELKGVISIKYPIELATEKVITQILKIDDIDRARTMLTNALSSKIEEYNIDNLYTKRQDEAVTTDDADPGRMLVNDSNWIDDILGIFRKIGIVDKKIHYDLDKDELDEVSDNLQNKVQRKGDVLMPSDSELRNLIINESKSAIRATVATIVEKILINKRQGNTDPAAINELLKNEFGEVNMEITNMIARKISIQLAVHDIPPPPYSPLISNISVNYSSVSDLSLASGEKVFHITPYGTIEKDLTKVESETPDDAVNATGVNHIFPERLVSPDINFQGLFFLGIKDVVPDQNLAVLLHLAEGPTGSDKKPPRISWFYYTNNNWVRMDNDRIISDSSFGFQTSGIIEFSIPPDAKSNYVLFDTPSLFWLCAGVEADTDAFPNLIDVKSQAALVTFRDHRLNPSHMAVSLEAGKIKTLIDEIPAVKKVTQPVSSFNGKLGETDREYYTRVSERLRHKSRAINNWDYERLTLEAFPSFFKVKCLNNYHNGDFAIGHVTIVPIADFRNKNFAGSNMLLPKTNYLDLRSIERFLSTKSSPFVRIHAVNPQLEQVLISCKVKFNANINKGFYLQRLNEDLIRFLTPWANGDLDTISFTAKIYVSSIINFIDRLAYVNYVSELKMEQYTQMENGEKIFVKNPDQLTSLVETDLKTGHSILVSAPKHNIELVE